MTDTSLARAFFPPNQSEPNCFGHSTARNSATKTSAIVTYHPDTGVNTVKVDAAGNISRPFMEPLARRTLNDEFAAKLSRDGSNLLYSTNFVNSKSDYVSALEIDSTRPTYVFGARSRR